MLHLLDLHFRTESVRQFHLSEEKISFEMRYMWLWDKPITENLCFQSSLSVERYQIWPERFEDFWAEGSKKLRGKNWILISEPESRHTKEEAMYFYTEEMRLLMGSSCSSCLGKMRYEKFNLAPFPLPIPNLYLIYLKINLGLKRPKPRSVDVDGDSSIRVNWDKMVAQFSLNSEWESETHPLTFLHFFLIRTSTFLCVSFYFTTHLAILWKMTLQK